MFVGGRVFACAVPWRPGEITGSPEGGVSVTWCESPDVSAGNRTLVLLTARPSLQLHFAVIALTHVPVHVHTRMDERVCRLHTCVHVEVREHPWKRMSEDIPRNTIRLL